MIDRRELLEPEHKYLSIRAQCELLQINRSSYYYQPTLVSEEDLRLLKLVDEIYTQHPFFGVRQMINYLANNLGIKIGRTKMGGIYKKLGLQAICPGPNISKPNPAHKIYPYLLRGVQIEKRDQVWSTDITYIRMHKGFVYLMAIIDWFSRYVLGWELNISLDADFCIETLERVLQNGRCDIFNTDQGSQFTSNAFTGVLKSHNIKISMDGKGRALDNIFVERLWRSVKYECIYLREFISVKSAYQNLKEYFLFYNNKRPHQGLGGKTPAEVYFAQC